MNIRQAASICYGFDTTEDEEKTRRMRIRILQSEAETERMRIKEFESQANAAAQKAFWARKRLHTINDELKQLEGS